MNAYWTREDSAFVSADSKGIVMLGADDWTRILATVDALEKESHTAMVLLLQSNDSEWLDHGRRLYDLLAALEAK